jgi:hypothetical protein
VKTVATSRHQCTSPAGPIQQHPPPWSPITTISRALNNNIARLPTHRCISAGMKRKPNTHMGTAPSKKTKRAAESAASTAPGPDHPVLRRLYPQVLTLRHYLLSQLPKSSKNRRRRLSQLGATPVQHDASAHDVDIQLGQLLDSALIGCFPATEPKNAAQEVKERDRDIENFTQQRSQNTSGGTFKPGYFLQSEVGRVTRIKGSAPCTWQCSQIWKLSEHRS